ncbi:MAG: IS110 family transposase [Acidimicrobiales bacterium]|nr:IS110 family transposase [Acidimicrobiales bacterium]
MTTIADDGCRVTVGIDTHGEVHVAAVLDERGRLLATESFVTTSKGHRQLEQWALGFGVIDAVGIEGTGAWGAGVARHFSAGGHRVVEVDRPDRKTRRLRGKSDTIDAEAAARAVQAGTATGTPKTRSGRIEAIRALRVARRSAIKARSQAAHQLHCLVSTAPDGVRDELRTLRLVDLVETAARFRPGDPRDTTQATKTALRSIARRYQQLTVELENLDELLGQLVAETAPNLVALNGVGTDVAGQLLVTAGDNPDRLRSDAAFSHLCGSSPIPASSGRTNRHRLNRGGDRAANAALYRIVLCRLRWDPRTRHYVERRTKEGLTKPEIIRCLKRYIAREIYTKLNRLPLDHP